ncbi:hypothetical protein FACS189450_07340 [Spirochaetia bacterium]|nr:hypothetical protein FACS189450_07340 [Spirochaetia bacterium]
MMRHIKPLITLIFISLLAAAAGPLAAATLEELVGAEQAAALKAAVAAGGTLTEVQLKNPAPRLVPQHAGVRRIVDETTKSLDPSLFVETLSLYAKPAASSRPVWSAVEKTDLFNGALALSTLSGIQYYSASRKTMRTFYETSQVIDGPETKRVVSDPVYAINSSDASAALKIYARQKDLTFGDNVYQYDYRAEEDFLLFIQENLTTMNAGIIRAMGKNKLRSLIAVIDAGDCLLIYAVSMAKASSLPGLGERIGNSFTNRAEAILKWYAGQADKAFAGG